MKSPKKTWDAGPDAGVTDLEEEREGMLVVLTLYKL